jgi:hypothetical protein
MVQILRVRAVGVDLEREARLDKVHKCIEAFEEISTN